MRYLGGKVKIAKWVSAWLLWRAKEEECDRYLEPFIGGAAIWEKVAPYFDHKMASDTHLDLILMWQAIASGWVPPMTVSSELYQELKQGEPSALRGFVGFGSTFGGKFFSGQVRKIKPNWRSKDFVKAARSSILRAGKSFMGAEIRRCDYRVHQPTKGTLVYCDPPYAGTTGYRGTAPFDSAEFWEVARRWSVAGATVIVSEEEAPKGWMILSEYKRKALLKVAKDRPNDVRTERLFEYEG